MTKDEDFAVRRGTADDGPQILWIRTGNSRRSTPLAWFACILPRAVVALDEGAGVVELRA